MSEVIDILEARQNMTCPRVAHKRLVCGRDPLPVEVTEDLEARFVGVFDGLRGWIAFDRQGYI